MREPDDALDSGFISDIRKSRRAFEERCQLQWEYYSELAFQRKRIDDALKTSLREQALPFKFAAWQRVVKYKHALSPLSSRGSISDPGGRFNIGCIDETRYPVFSALYLASDRSTALAELLGQTAVATSLTAEELALTRPDSITAVSVSGMLESVLDVRDGRNLAGFVDLIKGFKISPALAIKARRLGLPPLQLIETADALVEEFHRKEWRNMPMMLDVPAPSQIFGRIVLDAGIEGLLFTSVRAGKPCLAVYTQNFLNSSSYIELDDPAPSEVVKRRIDATHCNDPD